MDFLDKLNLRPNEKRLVVGIFVVLFVVLNLWVIRPHFNDWNKSKNALQRAHRNLLTYKAEIAAIPANEAKLRKLQGEGGSVPTEEQAVHLRRKLDELVSKSGIFSQNINFAAKRSADTNSFFEEQTVTMGFYNTGDKELLDFLFRLGADDSMIRVRDLSVKPDASMTKLQGSLSLTASFQKKTGPKSTAPAEGKPVMPSPNPAAPSTQRKI
jgi:hypothetical protein